MKKISIINNVNGRQFGAQFETQELAQAWIDQQVAKNSWGKPDRWLQETDGTHSDVRVVESDEGNYNEYFFPCDYEISIVDISEEYDRKQRLANLKKDAAKNIKDIEFGLDLIGYVGKLNEDKNLTHEQKNSMKSNSYIKNIMFMLQAGRIGYAKSLVELYQPDGVLLTEQDRQGILQLINDYLAETL
jgi:hypothetical protein